MSYVPPAKLRKLNENKAKDPEFLQRQHWIETSKKINGIVNKVTAQNVQKVVVELFNLNLVRFRGVLTSSIIKNQQQSQEFTPVYCAMIAVINSKIPSVGKLLVNRLVINFRLFYKQNDKRGLNSTLKFLSMLMNFRIVKESLILEILLVLMKDNTMNNDSIELAVDLMRQSGVFFQIFDKPVLDKVCDKLKTIMYAYKAISKKNKYAIEQLFKQKNDGFRGASLIPQEEYLDLVEEEDMVTHKVGLMDKKVKYEKKLDEFRVDKEFEANEEKYEQIRREILGDRESSESKDELEESEAAEIVTQELDDSDQEHRTQTEEPESGIKDMTETNMINFQKAVYLTIMSSMSSDEAVHKLIKLQIPGLSFKANSTEFQEKLVEIIVRATSLEKSFSKYHAMIGSKLCSISTTWHNIFVKVFAKSYETCDVLKSVELRNVGKFWGFQLASDVLSFESLADVVLTEETTNSSQRVFLKLLFETIVEMLGLAKSAEILQSEDVRQYIRGIFPYPDLEADDSEIGEKLRFSINFFTAIGLGGLTDNMRQNLKEIT